MCVSAGEWSAPLPGSMPGYSQSMSMPSKIPAAEPGPPSSFQPPAGRFPLMNWSTHDATNACRDAAVAAASEKYFENVQPPIAMTSFSPGCAALILANSATLPSTCGLERSGTSEVRKGVS